MNWFKRKKDIQVNQRVNYTPVGGVYTSNFNNTLSFAKNGYMANTAIYAIINLIARKFSYMPVIVNDIKDMAKFREMRTLQKQYPRPTGNVQARIDELAEKALDRYTASDPITQLLYNPNQYQGMAELWENFMGWKQITGMACLWGQPKSESNSQPVELHVLPSTQVNIIGDKDNIHKVLNYYLTQIPGQKIDGDEILRWIYWSPMFDPYARQHLYGLSPLQSMSATVDENIEMTKAGARMAANDGAKGIVFGKGVMIPAEQIDEVQERLDTKVNGNENISKVAAFASEMGYLQLGLDSQKMQIVESRQFSFSELCNGFNVPVNCFSLQSGRSSGLTNSSGATTDAAMKQLIVDKIIPEWCQFRDHLNMWLLPKFNLQQKKWIDFDSGALPEMQKDLAKISTAMMNSPWLTYNEKRQAMGYEPLTDPFMDQIIIPTGQTLLDDIESNSPSGMQQSNFDNQPNDYAAA